MTPQEIEALKAERDALAAQVGCLRQTIKLAILTFQQYELDVDECPTIQHNKMMKKLIGSTESTPQQCLREVQAEAVKKFVEFNAGRYTNHFDLCLSDALETYLAWAQQGGAE